MARGHIRLREILEGVTRDASDRMDRAARKKHSERNRAQKLLWGCVFRRNFSRWWFTLISTTRVYQALKKPICVATVTAWMNKAVRLDRLLSNHGLCTRSTALVHKFNSSCSSSLVLCDVSYTLSTVSRLWILCFRVSHFHRHLPIPRDIFENMMSGYLGNPECILSMWKIHEWWRLTASHWSILFRMFHFSDIPLFIGTDLQYFFTSLQITFAVEWEIAQMTKSFTISCHLLSWIGVTVLLSKREGWISGRVDSSSWVSMVNSFHLEVFFLLEPLIFFRRHRVSNLDPQMEKWGLGKGVWSATWQRSKGDRSEWFRFGRDDDLWKCLPPPLFYCFFSSLPFKIFLWLISRLNLCVQPSSKLLMRKPTG